MKKGKKSRSFAKKKIIFITLIMSMSFIGVGYAEWNDSLLVDLSIKTGNIRRSFDIVNYKSYDDGELYFSVSDDGSSLNIKGKVYPTFNEDLTINLVDSGSLPSIITDIHADNNDISSLKGLVGNKTALNSNFNKKLNSFSININPSSNDDKDSISKLNIVSSNCNDVCSGLEDEINNLSNIINIYNTVEKRNFKYKISYEFGKSIWEKDLIIEGSIDVIPNPEVLSNMEIKLNELQNKLNEKYEAQKILEEQLRLLEEQKQLEEINDENSQEQNEGDNENQNNGTNLDNNFIPTTESENIVKPELNNDIVLDIEEITNEIETEELINESNEIDNQELDVNDEQITETSDLTKDLEESRTEQENFPEENKQLENTVVNEQVDETI